MMTSSKLLRAWVAGLTALVVLTCGPGSQAANRKPIVIGATGQQQQLQSGDVLVDPSGTAYSAGAAPGGSSGQIQYNNSGAFGGAAVSGDCTATILAFTCTKLNGVSPGYFFSGTDAANLTGVLGATHGGAGTISGLLKANGSGTVSAAASGTDYAPATSGSSLLYGNGSGGFSNATIGAGLSFSGGSLVNTGTGGSATWTANPFCATSGSGNPCIRYGTGTPPSTDPNGSLFLATDTGKIYTTTNSGSPSPARVQEVVNGATFAVTMGSTPTTGNTLIGFCHKDTALATPNTGWTKYGDNSSNFVETNITVVWKRVTASDTTSQTPCAGGATTKSGVAVIEVSGVSVTFTDSVSFLQVGGATLSGSTTDANSELISFAAWWGASGTALLVNSGSGWSNNAASNSVGGPNAQTINSQFVSSASTSYSSSYNSPFGFPPGTIVLALKPSVNATRQLSWLITMMNAGTAIDLNPVSLNFSTGLTATTDGGGNITVTGAVGTVTTTGSPASGNLAKFSGATSVTSGDLSGDCTTAGTLAVVCLKTNGTSFGTFATQNYATPPAIGGTTPAAGSFTTLSVSSSLTTNVTGSTQCLHVNTSGVVSGTGSDCGAGGGGSVTDDYKAARSATFMSAFGGL